jgi:Integrase core domain
MRLIKTPVRSPRANARAGRRAGTVEAECADRMLVDDEAHLQDWCGRYDGHRPHQWVKYRRDQRIRRAGVALGWRGSRARTDTMRVIQIVR